jgi:hypothetical protein
MLKGFLGCCRLDRKQQPLDPVKVKHRSHAFFVTFQARANCLRIVIFSLAELLATAVAAALYLRRMRCQMINGVALEACSPSTKPRNNLVRRQHIVDHAGKRHSFGLEQVLERLGLRRCAWEGNQKRA